MKTIQNSALDFQKQNIRDKSNYWAGNRGTTN